jgi:hypothetical protein
VPAVLTIFSRMGSSSTAGGQHGDEEQQNKPSPSVSGSSSESSSEDIGVLELGGRDIGPYKRFHVVDAASFDRNKLAAGDTLLPRRSK